MPDKIKQVCLQVVKLTAGDMNEGTENELKAVPMVDYMHCILKLGKSQI